MISAGRSASGIPVSLPIQHIGRGVVILSGLALVDAHRMVATGYRLAQRDRVETPGRVSTLMRVLAVAAGEAAEDMQDAGDVRPPPAATQSTEPDQRIGTTEVAQMMDVTERHARRLSKTLDAWKDHGKLVFDRATVAAYIAGRDEVSA